MLWQEKGAAAALALRDSHNRNSRCCIREGGEKNMVRKGVKVVRQELGEGLAFWQEDDVNLIIWGDVRKTEFRLKGLQNYLKQKKMQSNCSKGKEKRGGAVALRGGRGSSKGFKCEGN